MQVLRNSRNPIANGRKGIALIPTLLVVSGLTVFTMALLSMTLSGKRTVVFQDDDYKLSSAVESVAVLAAERLWSTYLADPAQAGQPGTIGTFRTFLNANGIPDSGPGGSPPVTAGTDLIPLLNLPSVNGQTRFNAVNVDAVQIVRRDVSADSTQLYLTVSASTSRGRGIVNPVLNRAVQQVYTVEPENFAGFDFALLTNNVNCIFCHTNFDSVQRYFNTDPSLYGSFDRVKVGSLESLMIRHDMDGKSWVVNDFDADSFIAGTVYSRGVIAEHTGAQVTNWGAQSFMGYGFDPATGAIVENSSGQLSPVVFSPAGTPPGPLENLYETYPTQYAAMPDGELPLSFPPPIPDDGGVDPVTGLPDPNAAGNRKVDKIEFDTIANTVIGEITAGVQTVLGSGQKIKTPSEYAAAVLVGNRTSIRNKETGNVLLSGTVNNPITIQGTVAIDGDLIIQGYVKGEGNLIVRGNVYVPTDLQYLDGRQYLPGDPPGAPSGPRTFGIDPNGGANALGIAAGGNIIVGDYQRPTSISPDPANPGGLLFTPPGWNETISGEASGKWSFPLAEMAIFNRNEWMRTQPTLPGPPDPVTGAPTTVVNPKYDANYVPRYYAHGKDDEVPIYNKGTLYYDLTTGMWLGGAEEALAWDPSLLTIADPKDPNDPILYPGTVNPVIETISPNDEWISDQMYKVGTNYYESTRAPGPMKLDGLFYTNNSIFALVSRARVDPSGNVVWSSMKGQLIINGSIVASDVGMLAPGFKPGAGYSGPTSPLSGYAIGLQLNYDERVRRLLNVKNPLQVTLKRTLWNPTRNVL